jgi:oxygen-independent coproporphyrinogen-3 oxidase
MKAGLYIHIPFCISRCSYCSFNSIPFNSVKAQKYISALTGEIEACENDVEPSSLYIGGGTPTVLPEMDILSLLKQVNNKFNLSPETEATMEANPGTLNKIDLARIKDSGINRVSLGVQSFKPAELRMLGRAHSREDIYNSVKKLKEAGFDNISVDLITSLPGQSIDDLTFSLDEAIGLGVQHISAYELSIEEGTRFCSEARAGRLVLPPESLQVEMYLKTAEILENSGFKRYEISNFALPGYECGHNLNYWACGYYLGFGAGAWSYLPGVRLANERDVEGYSIAAGQGKSAVLSRETITAVDAEKEYVMLGLRKAAGFSAAEFRERFGHDVMESYREKIGGLTAGGFIEFSGGNLRLTLKGVLASNPVTAEFF